MPYAELTVTIPESVWIGDLSRRRPETRFRVLAATATEEVGVVRLEIVGEDPAAVLEDVRRYDAVTSVTVFESAETSYRVQLESTVAVLLSAVQASGVPLETPFEVRDGRLELSTTIPRERLSAFGETLDGLGIQYTLERVQEDVESEDALLTDRQRWLLDEAIERGYYDTPRRSTLTELAEELDLAASTCSEVLHRAEERVVKEHVRETRSQAPEMPLVDAD